MKSDYLKQIQQTDKKIAELEARKNQLIKERDQNPPDQLSNARRIRKEIEETDGDLSELRRWKQAGETQLKTWTEASAKAKPLVEANMAAHERGRQNFVKLAKYQEGVRGVLKDQDQVNVILSTNARQFEDFTGESMGCTLSMVCYQASAFASAETIKPYDPWTYRSETELKTEHHRMEAEQFKQYQDGVAVANQRSPACARCGGKTAVDMHAGVKERPGAGVSAGDWHFICKQCGNMQGAIIAETK